MLINIYDHKHFKEYRQGSHSPLTPHGWFTHYVSTSCREFSVLNAPYLMS